MFITNPEFFGEFSMALVHSDSVQWHLTGKTSVDVAGLTYDGINFDKLINIPGTSTITLLLVRDSMLTQSISIQLLEGSRT